MINKKDFIVIGSISILISLTGFLFDLHERVQNILTNVFEIGMMAVFLFGIIFIPYFFVKLLISKFSKQKS